MKLKIWIILVVLSLVLAACNETDRVSRSNSITPESEPSSTWIDAPLPDAKLPLLPYKLVFHGASFSSVDEFKVQINGAEIASVQAVPSNINGTENETLFLGDYLWTPPAPGTYLITVWSRSQGEFSSMDEVRVVVGEEEKEEESLPPTPTLTPSLTPTAIAMEAEDCMYTALVNIFCRIGPGMNFDVGDSLVPNQSALIVGESIDGLYWYLLGPYTGEVCAVTKDPKYGLISGDCDEKPAFTPPPTPISTPTTTATDPPVERPTSTPTENPMGCTVIQADGSLKCIVPCPVGAEPGDVCTP